MILSKQPIRRGRHPRSVRRGAAAVEFALISPLFLLLVLGSIDVSRLLMAKTVLANASREACRVAILPTAKPDEIQEIAERIAEAGMVTGVDVSISHEAANFGNGKFVTVTVSVSFAQLTWTGILLTMGDRELKTATTMRQESP